MKKFLIYLLIILVLGFSGYYAFIYFFSFSKGVRAGELVKFSRKGVLYKTWEGEISQGVSKEKTFYFSVQDNEPKVIEKLQNFQGRNVKLTYKKRYKTFPWWGDTEYFVTDVIETDNKNSINDQPNSYDKSNVNNILKKKNDSLKEVIKDLETTIEVLKKSFQNQ